MKFSFGRVSAVGLALRMLAMSAGGPLTAADRSPTIFDMESIQHHPSEFTNELQQKTPIGSADLVSGKFGQAVKFTFQSQAPGFMTAGVRPTADWDRSAGFSFWVKGDGSKNCGGIELIDRDDFRLRYGYCFPIDSTEWRKITVRWGDVIPELNGPLVDAQKGYSPARFGNCWFGRWFYWENSRPVPTRSTE